MSGKLLRPEEVEAPPLNYTSSLPWYGVTAGTVLGGLGGEALASKLNPKYRLAGTLLGSMAGTGAGLHGGEAVGRLLDAREARQKVAEEQKQKEEEEGRLSKVLKVMGKQFLGFSGGALTGAALGVGGPLAYKAITGKSVPLKYLIGIPAVLGTAMHLARPIAHAFQKEELDRALENPSQQTG